MMLRMTTAALAALVLAGCGSPAKFKETPEGNQSVENLDEAGSVHVAVLAVTPWEEIKAKLRPNLKIDEKDLRNQAVPVTFALLDKYLDILRVRASLAPTTVRNTSSTTTTTETGKDDVTKTDSSTATAPGTARNTDGPAALAAGSAPSIAASGVSAINSSLTARAMASFVQDIQALNAEVDGAAKRTGFTPYLVRVQVSVMPRRRHLGYDVYSNLSFFGYGGTFNAATGKAERRDPVEGTPFVVPLLSSDSIETAQRSQSMEAIRDVGVALDLVKGFGAAGFSVGSQRDRQQALQGLDVNSVLTMGRLSDNTLRVRFGAAYDPGGGFAVHPRTNTISVLVFFPTNATQTRVVSRSAWTHVINGSVLERSSERYHSKLQPIVEQWGHLGVTTSLLEEIDELPTEGNYARFIEKVSAGMKAHCRTPPVGKDLPKACYGVEKHELDRPDNRYEKERSLAYLWTHLLSVLPGSRFSTTVVDLPRLVPSCPVDKQLAAYVEDDKGLSVTLRNGKDLGVESLKAALHWAYLVPADPPAAPAAPVVAPASAPAAALHKAKVEDKARKGKAAAAPKAVLVVATPASDEKPKLQVKGHAGALMASEISVSEDRRAATAYFASERMVPVAWSGKGEQLAPVAIELSGCAAGAAPTLPPEWQLTPVFGGASSQLYKLSVHVPKKGTGEEKPKPTATLSVGTAELLILEKQPTKTRVTIDLGEKPKTGFALTTSGAVIESLGPAAKVELRADGSYLVKESGTLDITFINVTVNRTIELELKPIDDKGKLGAAAAKLALTARAAKA